MPVLIRLSLVLVLLLSAASLGAARGQMRAAGTVVLCAGAAVSVQAVDINGRPVPVTHICPDMALSLMAAVAGPPVLPVRAEAAGAVLDPAADAVARSGRSAVAHRARGPPVAG